MKVKFEIYDFRENVDLSITKNSSYDDAHAMAKKFFFPEDLTARDELILFAVKNISWEPESVDSNIIRPNKIRTIKALKDKYPFISLKEAKDIVESFLPHYVL